MSLEQKRIINQFIEEFGFDPFSLPGQQDAQSVAQGWKLVPVKVTEEMEKAWWTNFGDVHALWAAMLNAAPMPPAQSVLRSTSPTALRPYEPTEHMRWAAKQLDPALTHEQIRAMWCAMWSAAPTLPAKQEAQAVAQGFDWSKFPGHLIDHYEGEVLTEELLQRAAADLCAAPTPPTPPTPPAQQDAQAINHIPDAREMVSPTYGSEEVRKLRETIQSMARIIRDYEAAPTPPAQATTCKQDLQVDALLDEMLEAAPAVAQVPQGWKLVPVAPTPEMRKAAADAWIDCGDRLILNKAAAAVRAGIAAAPTPPAQRVMLTDEEIRDLWSWSMTAEAERTANTQQHAFAQGVIEAYERKNGISRHAKASDQSL